MSGHLDFMVLFKERGLNNKVSDSVVLRWIIEIRCTYDAARPAYYTDGHKKPNVVEYRRWCREEFGGGAFACFGGSESAKVMCRRRSSMPSIPGKERWISRKRLREYFEEEGSNARSSALTGLTRQRISVGNRGGIGDVDDAYVRPHPCDVIPVMSSL